MGALINPRLDPRLARAIPLYMPLVETLFYCDFTAHSDLGDLFIQDNPGAPNTISITVRPGYVRLETVAAFTDWWTGTYTSPAIRRDMSKITNFELLTKMNVSNIDANSNQCGIGIFERGNPDNGVKFYRGHVFGVDRIRSENIGVGGITIITEVSVNDIWLRIVKNGNNLAFYYKIENTNFPTPGGWTAVGTIVKAIPNPQVLLYEATAEAGGTATGDFKFMVLKAI